MTDAKVMIPDFGEPEGIAARRSTAPVPDEPRAMPPTVPTGTASDALRKAVLASLDRSGSGAIIKSAMNVMTIFKMHRLRFAKNDFTGRLMVLEAPPGWPMPATREIDDD